MEKKNEKLAAYTRKSPCYFLPSFVTSPTKDAKNVAKNIVSELKKSTEVSI